MKRIEAGVSQGKTKKKEPGSPCRCLFENIILIRIQYSKLKMMKSLKTALIQFVLDKPLRFRVILFLGGVLVAAVHPWFGTEKTATLSQAGMALLLGFSTLVYAFMLTLYRIMQKLFRWGRALPDHIRNYDERELVKILGLFWFLPFGGILHLMALFSIADERNFGAILIIQGLAFAMGARLSQVVKK